MQYIPNYTYSMLWTACKKKQQENAAKKKTRAERRQEVSVDITQPSSQLHNFQPYEYCGSEVQLYPNNQMQFN